MVNKSIILRLLNNIESYITDLNEINQISIKEYKGDIKTQRFVERTLQIATEAMFDIAHHIISDEKFREANTYSDAFTVLNENQIIDKSFLPTAKLMAQFRNKIVHYYENIDPDLVYSIAKNRRTDFIQFVELIRNWIAEN